MSNLGDTIKEELLTHQIKASCCKASFITGTELFAKSRKNKFSERIAEYKERLSHKKKRTFFDEDVGVGFSIGEEDGQKIPIGGKTCPYCHSMLMRGAFLVCGRASVSEGKKKDYHVEMAVPNGKTASLISAALGEIGIEPKRAVRRGEILLYYKKREAIADFVAYIGAVTQSFELINNGIMNRTMTAVRRQTFCDEINIQKSLDAAKRQTDAINAIRERGALGELPAELRETAKIRLENPIEPLGVITELHGGKLSRSAVNRRLHKIIEWAEKKGYIIK